MWTRVERPANDKKRLKHYVWSSHRCFPLARSMMDKNLLSRLIFYLFIALGMREPGLAETTPSKKLWVMSLLPSQK